MRTSSTHRRIAAALSASALALVFSLGSPAFGGEKSQAGERGKGGPEKTETPYVSGSTDDDSVDPDPAHDSDNAHPSGKDRHEDQGTQGSSTSDPDDNDRGPERDNGDADKPFEGEDGTGGLDLQDQDGNNGCGNDDDFEDDNEGWCGKPETTPPTEVGGTTTEKCPEGTTMVEGGTAPQDCKTTPEIVIESSNPIIVTNTAPGAVLASELQTTQETQAATLAEDASVLGVQLERTAPAAVAAENAAAPAASVLGVSLARTGMSFTLIALAIALGLLAVGFGLKRAGRTTSDI